MGLSFNDYIGGAIGLGNLGLGVASLFGAGANDQNFANSNQSSFIAHSTPYNLPIVTPGYTFAGGALMNRNNDFLDANRKLSQLYGQQLGGLNSFLSGPMTQLRAELKPGYGRLTDTMVQGVRNQQQQAVGNLRDQLAQRGVLGASFANNQVQQVNSEYMQKENEARAQAFQQEMASTLGLNQQQIDVLAQILANANAQGTRADQVQQNSLAEMALASSFLKNVTQKDTPAIDAYKNQAVGAAMTNLPPGTTAPGGGTGGVPPGGGTGGFPGLPVPPKDSNRWTQAYKQFLAAGDAAGYLAWLRANHKGGY